MKKVSLIILVILISGIEKAPSQELQKETLSNLDRKKGLQAKYSYYNQYDGYINLFLHSDGTYVYDLVIRNGGHNRGSWSCYNNTVSLVGDIDRDSIPITLEYLPTNSDAKWVKKTIIDMLVNSNGDFLSESRVFINNDSTYFFPFFDTCIGAPTSFDSLKVSFGKGFYSKWIPMEKKAFGLLKITTPIDIDRLKGAYFKERKYIIKGNKLVLADD